MQKKMMSMLWTLPFTCFAFFSLFWTEQAIHAPVYGSWFLPRMLVRSCALFTRFAHNLMLFLCRIHREIASGQIHDSKRKDVKISTSTQPRDILYWLPRYASTVIYRCIPLPQLLYRWKHQSRKLWMPHRNNFILKYSSDFKKCSPIRDSN
jgi:hypothetical protein